MQKEIKWYEFLYSVTDSGKVFSLVRYVNCKNWKRQIWWNTLKQTINWWYVYVALYKWKKQKQIKVSRLVAQAFLWLNINDKKLYVLYKDNDKKNNNLLNLRIWTNEDRIKKCIEAWNFITHKKKRKSTAYQEQTKTIFNLVDKGYTWRDIAKLMNMSEGYISMIKNKKRRVYKINY